MTINIKSYIIDKNFIMKGNKKMNTQEVVNSIMDDYNKGKKYLKEYSDKEFKVIARELLIKHLESGTEISEELECELYAREISKKELLN